MLEDKSIDPWAAAVGAYLLLRLRRFDLLHTWARNLADRFSFADGCIIWASQAIIERKDGSEASKYLLEAVKRGLPVYTEGLKLLSQGLRLIGEPGQEALKEISRSTGRVLWTSPFTALFEGEVHSKGVAPTIAVGYLPPT